MAGKTFFGNGSNKAKIPSKIYIGVSNKAQLVEKIYVGDSSNKARKVWPISILPAAYQQVEYIQNSGGTQLINVGIGAVYNTTKIEMDFEPVDNHSGRAQSRYLFGCYLSGQDSSLDGYRYHSEYTLSEDTFYYNFGRHYSTVSDYFTYEFEEGQRYKLILMDDGGYSYVNGKSVYTTTNTFSSTSVYNSNKKEVKFDLLLFGCKIMESGGNATNYPSKNIFKLYHWAIWQNGKLLRDLYPCYRKSDNVIGLYDAAAKVFRTNVGTGTFYKGPNV